MEDQRGDENYSTELAVGGTQIMDGEEHEKHIYKFPASRAYDISAIHDFNFHIYLIDRVVNKGELWHMKRIVRDLSVIRRKLHSVHLQKFTLVLPIFVRRKLGFAKPPPPPEEVIPEKYFYVQLMVLMYSVDKACPNSHQLSSGAVSKLVLHNRRSLDPFAAKMYYLYSRSYELAGRLDEVRAVLSARLLTATLTRDLESQAMLINLLLRNYIHYNMYDDAERLALKTSFPKSASNNEWAKYFYYTGRIKTIQLEYSEARDCLVHALRKAPKMAAVGFKQTVTKLLVVVQLLLGLIPERAEFEKDSMKPALDRYFRLTQAVRAGDLKLFNDTLTKHCERFEADRMFTLVLRVRHNVLKTAVRQLCLSYCGISLCDAAEKLQLDCALDAEYIIAKAIKDGIVEAEIDHESGTVSTRDTTDVYGTAEPMWVYRQRIAFCLDMHRSFVRSMVFRPRIRRYKRVLSYPQTK